MIEFTEVQQFRRWWAWAAVLALNGLFIFAIIQQVILGKPFGAKPASDIGLILLECIPLLLLIVLFSIQLKTTINEKGIYYRFYPFQFKTTFIAWEELSDAYMRQYHSLYEYGGWGIRIGSPKTGNAINTSASCNTGLQLKFRDGKLLLIGTRRPAELKAMIDKIKTGIKI
jgi:hypothetical protein